MTIHVVKRGGERVPLDYEKIHKVIDFAGENLSNVSVSQIATSSHIKFFDGITTEDIHNTLIKTADGLTSVETPNYQFVAGRLLNIKLRKDVYKQWDVPHLYDIVVKNVESGYYTKELLEYYTKEEFNQLNSMLDHSRDERFNYCAMKQFISKYLVKDRQTKEVKETPQIAYILVSAILLKDEPNRMKLIKESYDMDSQADKSLVTLPTPVIAGVRTPVKQFSSCCVIKAGDNLKSINESTSAVVDYVSKRAGIGLDISSLRAFGDSINNGYATHTGVIPFLKMYEAATHSCSQGAIRCLHPDTYVEIIDR